MAAGGFYFVTFFTITYVEVKLQALEEIKGSLFHMLDNVNTVLLALRRRYKNQNTYTKAEEVRRKRRMKEQKERTRPRSGKYCQGRLKRCVNF